MPTTSAPLRVCVTGATGWAASALCRGIVAAPDLELVAAVARRTAGQRLQDVLDLPAAADIPIFGTLEEALRVPSDVVVEYTSAAAARHHVTTALQQGRAVVVGSSGLTEADYAALATLAQQHGRPVLAVGNFAISVVLLNKFSELAARYLPQWEIIDYASATKPDAPSGSALELASRLAAVAPPQRPVPLDQTHGLPQARGAEVAGTLVHSVRLPGFVISLESIFGQESETLTLRHTAGQSATPYVEGALLAIRKVQTLTGLVRGLDRVMEWTW